MEKEWRKKMPRWLRIRGNYQKNLVIFLLLASFPGIIFSFLLFFLSKSQMERELQTVHQNHMTYMIQTIKDEFSDLELLMANWSTNSNMQGYSDLDVVSDYVQIKNLYNTLNLMGGYNPLIGRVELFLNQPSPIVYTENGYKFLEDAQVLDEYTRLLTSKQKMFWDHSLTSIESVYKDRYAPLAMVHNLDGNLFEPFGSLIVFLEREKLHNMLQSPYEDGSVFMQQNDNRWLFGKPEQTEPSKLQMEIMAEIQSRGDDAEPFVFHYDNIKYTITYDSFSRLGEQWCYVSIAPMTNITAPVVLIFKIFIYLNLFIFMSAITLTLLVSKKLYAPIEKLTRQIGGTHLHPANEFNMIESHMNELSAESENLQNRLNRQMPHLREGFILQLMQGYLYAYQEEELQARMQQFGSGGSEKKYVIVFVQMLGFNKLKERFAEEDKGLVTFLAVNIAEELLLFSEPETDVLNFHDLSFGILFSFNGDKHVHEIEKNVLNFCEELISYINTICKMNVSVGISRMAESLKSVHSIFEEIKISLSFRNLQEDNQIIEMKKMDSLLSSQDQGEYPFELEKEIIHAMRQRQQEEAIRLVHDFFAISNDRTRTVSEAVIRQRAFKLLGAIFHIVLQSGMIEDFINGSAHLYEKLYKLKEPEEISHWFERKVIIPIIEELSLKQDQRLQMVVQKVMHTLEANYTEDISLEACASDVNLNPSFLSKIFRDVSGWNFIDYLTHIRLSKAKELLIETDAKIKDVAEGVGYNQHSYFNRIFKKEEGITPSEFREMNRKN
ncbi:helix-turn-helix transcriptional regulator [Paenibacillus fonticola]|uniref:helix-turn-helix transcriptional regulator n=1 Tax=Paenibacillus fonticola TaxID=379896 RepID=UPI0003600ABE|nr:AraC family transcriptional regulator [Paenibacillus fonticola]